MHEPIIYTKVERIYREHIQYYSGIYWITTDKYFMQCLLLEWEKI